MNIEQYKARSDAKRQMKVLRQEEQIEVERLKQEANVVRAMSRTPGWKALERYFQRTDARYKEKFKYISTEKELFKLQADIKANEELVKFVYDLIAQAEAEEKAL